MSHKYVGSKQYNIKNVNMFILGCVDCSARAVWMIFAAEVN